MQSIMGNVLNAHAQLKDTLCNIHELSKECLKFPARLIQGSYDLQSQTIKVRAVFDRRARSEKSICQKPGKKHTHEKMWSDAGGNSPSFHAANFPAF